MIVINLFISVTIFVKIFDLVTKISVLQSRSDQGNRLRSKGIYFIEVDGMVKQKVVRAK